MDDLSGTECLSFLGATLAEGAGVRVPAMPACGQEQRWVQSRRGSGQCRSLGTPPPASKLGGSFAYIRCVCSGREELRE